MLNPLPNVFETNKSISSAALGIFNKKKLL